jgi:hypothetical protein
MKTITFAAVLLAVTPALAGTTICNNVPFGNGDIQQICRDALTYQLKSVCTTHQFWVGSEDQIGHGRPEDYQTTCETGDQRVLTPSSAATISLCPRTSCTRKTSSKASAITPGEFVYGRGQLTFYLNTARV